MVATAAMRNTLANSYATANPYVGILSALTLQSAVSAGATTCSVDLSAVVGDTLVFDQGQGTQESKVVTVVSGAGPYTLTFSALGFAHPSGNMVSQVPSANGNGHELSGGTYARIATNWGSASSSAVVSVPAAINVPINAKIGSIALFSASSGGVMNDAAAIPGQNYTTAGTYAPTCTYVQG